MHTIHETVIFTCGIAIHKSCRNCCVIITLYTTPNHLKIKARVVAYFQQEYSNSPDSYQLSHERSSVKGSARDDWKVFPLSITPRANFAPASRVQFSAVLKLQRPLDSTWTRTTTSTRFNFHQKKLALLSLVKEVARSLDRKMTKLVTFDNLFSPPRHSC